ncbi:MAG TPA: thiol peroxidase [Acidiferrobacteraceae bacterium]|nr:thiol peroxidase [Acidiferrobacteraceae bacterium]
MANITLKGDAIKTNADLPEVGSEAPDFTLVDGDLNNVSLANYKGKKKLISIVPSLDTGVCATSTKVFNEHFAGRDDAVALIVSADLPFAQKRFCDMEKVGNVQALSMMRDRHFAKDYGVLVEDGPLAGITARAVLVLDEDNTVLHAELVPEIAQEPDYDLAIAAIKPSSGNAD